MKIASLILLIAGCALAPCIAYASVANLATQQSSGNATPTTDAGRVHSTDTGLATVSNQSKDEKKALASNERGNSRRIFNKNRSHSRANLTRTNRARPKDVRSVHQQVPTKRSAGASKVVKIHTLDVGPATGVAISGQQFRNGRARSATPAAVGGPANTRKKTGTISGTGVNRRHVN